MKIFYVAQEKALAPGSSGDWPAVIKKPGSSNGRLVRIDALDQVLQRCDGIISGLRHGVFCEAPEYCDDLDDLLKKNREILE